jgi:hypothetical protein
MAYPGRPTLSVLAEFVGTATIRQTAQQRARLLTFCSEEHAAGRSIRELAELTGRTQSAVRRALDSAGVDSAPSGGGLLRGFLGAHGPLVMAAVSVSLVLYSSAMDASER